MSALASLPNLISLPRELAETGTCSEVELVGGDEGTSSSKGICSDGVFREGFDNALHIPLDF
jgi:hypothetical protein